MEDATRQERLRSLPSIDELLTRPSVTSLFTGAPRHLAVAVAREAVARARDRLLKGEGADFSEADLRAVLDARARFGLRPVINATGVVLHTNLGRAPLSESAIARIAEVARGYSNLELDLSTGERGSRYAPVRELLCALTGAEAALVVNNCAASVLLALSALASGKQAVVSRGELVEIGGGFRVPDVMRQSGAVLVEVGTTNRTRLADYAEALGPDTGALVKVHRSNFAMVGFTEDVAVKALAELSRERGVPLFVDLGSGVLTALVGEGLTSEPTVASVIAAGADLVAFSGDKLLGGPQAGVLVGKKAVIDRLERHPLNRALRIDKLTVAALEATLFAYRDGREAVEIPVRRLLAQSAAGLRLRAEQLAAPLSAAGIACRIVETVAQVGGGCMPQAAPVSVGVFVAGGGVEAASARLRDGEPAVMARVSDEQLILDVFCVDDAELPALAERVISACGGAP